MANELQPIEDPFIFTPEELELGQQENSDIDFDMLQEDIEDPFIFTPEELNGPSQTSKKYKKDSFIINKLARSASRGIGKGSAGAVAKTLIGSEEDNEVADSLLEGIVELGGEALSDAPANMSGAALGALVGGLIGSIIPGAGTVAGAQTGAVIFSIAFPTIIKESLREYNDYAKQGGNATLGGFISRAGHVLKETGKAGTVGLVASKASKLLPLLNKIPVYKKILNTKIGRSATDRALEYGSITTAQSLLEGEMPTTEQLKNNALAMVGGMIAHKFGVPIKKYLPEPIKKAPSRIVEKLPSVIRKPIQKIQGYTQEIKQSIQNKEAFDLLKEHVGERDAQIFKTQLEFRDKIYKKENGKRVPKFTPTQLEEASYLRQKTGNPNITGDTYESLEKRTSPQVKKLVNDVDTYFKQRLKQINSDPRLKDINPRDTLIDTYLPGLYEGDIKKAVQTKGFPELTPFSKEKQFLTHEEAIKARLKPKYKSIVENVAVYDEITNKTLAKSKMINAIEKTPGDTPLIVRSNNAELYNKVKNLGFVPFEESILKRYETPTGEWKTAAGPVLIDPKIADAFQGVFSKEGFKQDSKFWRNFDNASNILKTVNVTLSPFHMVPLTESAVGALGFSKGLNFKWIAKQGDQLLNSKQFMVDAVRNGVKFEKPIDYNKGSNLINRGLDQIASKGGKITNSVIGKTKKVLNYMFEVYHPRLKAVTYNELLNKELTNLIKAGKPATPEQRKAIGRDIASLVNNIYGGQQWETSKWLNDKNTMKKLSRVIAYPDWTISALKQAGSAFASRTKGRLGRKYWTNYIIKTSLMQGALKYFFGGWEQTDKKNNSIRGVRWSREKASKNFWNGDPSKWYMFSLPDVNIKVGSSIFNPGRDTRNKRAYGHLGKQALEIFGYITNPVQTLFGKTNPVLRILNQQLIGSTPSDDTNYPVRGKYDQGEFKPWDATKPYTPERVVSRIKSLMQGVLPFSVSSLTSKGFGVYIGSGLGAIPISQGMSLRKAENYVARALKRKDSKLLSNVIKTLIDNGYKDSSIKALITKVSSRVSKNR